TDIILITGQSWDTVNIIPSRSSLDYVQHLDRYVATGCVVNLLNKPQKCQITGKIELVNNWKAVHLVSENKNQLRRAISQHPLGREIMLSDKEFTSHVPLPT
ncbi:hypothetical protein DC007_14815, partial [Enterococcus faecalis]